MPRLSGALTDLLTFISEATGSWFLVTVPTPTSIQPSATAFPLRICTRLSLPGVWPVGGGASVAFPHLLQVSVECLFLR
jgi:hypothetical protein